MGGKFPRNVLLIPLLHKTDSVFSQEINMKETKAGSTLYQIALRVDEKKYQAQYEHSLIKGSGHAIFSIFALLISELTTV